MEDYYLKCQSCGRDFIFTENEQNWLKTKGLTIFLPKICKPCREDRNQRRQRKQPLTVKYENSSIEVDPANTVGFVGH